MKSNQTLRILSLVGFLLLIAPFYQQCNGKVEVPTEEVAVDTTAIEIPSFDKNKSITENSKTEDSIVQQEKVEFSTFQKAYNLIDDDGNENAFELSLQFNAYFEGSFEEFKKELFKDFSEHDYGGLFFIIRSFLFCLIVLFSFFLFMLSFTKRMNWVHKLSKINLFFILTTIICILFLDPFFETYKQIKWGYYAFTFVQIAIFYTSKLNSKTKSVSS